MKTLSVFTLSLLLSIPVFSQLPVSTQPQNKKALLEVFTGFNCWWGAEGHKMANQVQDAHPGNVFLIFYHQGAYANPATNQPDFRIPFANQLANLAQVSFYPSGTVNRTPYLSPYTSMGRHDWADAAYNQVYLPTYVNIGMQTTINWATRLLTVDVEVYFTSDGPDSVFLNLAVLQDNVEGPQHTMEQNPAQVLPNGNYNHLHMFRKSLTGQWGTAITSTDSGDLYGSQFSWTVPSDINDVDIALQNLKVIGYISEGFQEVVSVNSSPINNVVPPPYTLTDLSVKWKEEGSITFCDQNISPKATIFNNGIHDVSNYRVGIKVDDMPTIWKTPNITIPALDSIDFTFPSLPIADGEHTIHFVIETGAGSYKIDTLYSNNIYKSGKFYTIDQNPASLPYSAEMEGQIGTLPANLTVINPENIRLYLVDKAVIQGAFPNDLGGYGQSLSSIRYDFIAIPYGEKASIIYPILDLSSSSGAFMAFDYAYSGNEINKGDELNIYISTDCGDSWTLLTKMTEDSLTTTVPPTAGNRFYPLANEWKTKHISLGDYLTNDHVLVRMEGISKEGNSLYIDNVTFDSWPLSVNEKMDDSNISIYPNPTKGLSYLNVESMYSQKVSIQITNITGQTVLWESYPLNFGNNTLTIQTENFASGTYHVQIIADDKIYSRVLVVQH